MIGQSIEWSLLSFIENQNNYPIINHIDGDPSNNNIENLEWCDSKHNVNHAFDNGLMKATRIKLTSKDGEQFIFRSMSRASEFIGMNSGYIGRKLNKGKKIKGYKVDVI